MSREIVCPSCGNRGEAAVDESGAFEVRGQFEGRAVRKCRKCGAGLAIGPFSGGFLGKPRLIPTDIWKRMEDMWRREFGSG